VKKEIEKPKLLIVEGRDEEEFFKAALRDHLGHTDIQVMPIGGKTSLTDNLLALVGDAKFTTVLSLAVIRDADAPIGEVPIIGAMVSEAAKAFQSVSSSLRHVRLPSPASHGQFAAGPPRVGIFIVPNGIDDGMLETLCLRAVSTLPEFACLDAYFQCLQGHQIVPNNLDKARAHAWLASRPESDKRVGEAAQARYWPWDSDVFQDLWTFVRSL
jgi:hypothetical protein